MSASVRMSRDELYAVRLSNISPELEPWQAPVQKEDDADEALATMATLLTNASDQPTTALKPLTNDCGICFADTIRGEKEYSAVLHRAATCLKLKKAVLKAVRLSLQGGESTPELRETSLLVSASSDASSLAGAVSPDNILSLASFVSSTAMAESMSTQYPPLYTSLVNSMTELLVKLIKQISMP